MERDLLTRRLSDFMIKISVNQIEDLVLGLKSHSQTKIPYVVKKPKNKSFNKVASLILASNIMVPKMKGKQKQRSIKKRKITKEVGNYVEFLK